MIKHFALLYRTPEYLLRPSVLTLVEDQCDDPSSPLLIS